MWFENSLTIYTLSGKNISVAASFWFIKWISDIYKISLIYGTELSQLSYTPRYLLLCGQCKVETRALNFCIGWALKLPLPE